MTQKSLLILLLFFSNSLVIAKKKTSDYFIGVNYGQNSEWKINKVLKSNGFSSVSQNQLHALIGLNVYPGNFILTGNWGFGIGPNTNLSKHSNRQGLIGLDLKYSIWKSSKGEFSAGLSFEYLYNYHILQESNTPIDLNSPTTIENSTVSIENSQYAFGPTVRFNLLKHKSFYPQITICYLIGIVNTPWMSNSIRVLNSPFERSSWLNFKLLIPIITK